MVLNIDFFREEKGGDPELIRNSQRGRYADVELVGKVVSADVEWRKGKMIIFVLFSISRIHF